MNFATLHLITHQILDNMLGAIARMAKFAEQNKNPLYMYILVIPSKPLLVMFSNRLVGPGRPGTDQDD
jgi:hypothetical protein